MADKLFNETFFKKNDYFRKELNLSKDQLKEIQSLIKNWQKNCESFNPDVDKETTDENEFVDILFKKILGYSGKGKDADNYNILPKFKIDGASATGKAGYADLSLGYFSKSPFSKGGQGGISAEVVIEFKGQDSDNLTKLSNRPDKLSPVDQCWKYLVNHASAKWGIVTNFNEIRIYNKEKGQNVYETFYFNVPEEEKHKFLPLSTETEILKLITILKKENLLTTNGVSKTGELLKNKGVEETKVLKEFYVEYKSLRSQIFYEALKYNTQYEFEKPKSELLQLVQKFLDRIIFCWFCEDSREHLIPTNILSGQLIESQLLPKNPYYKKDQFDIYGKVKNLFRVIDEGKDFGIDSGYNGELFKKDKELDGLDIPNLIFEEISRIGLKYDFGDENELNVNILGHIFEQSISDLEEMRVSFQELDQTPKKQEKQHIMEFAKEVDVLEHKLTEFDAKKTKRKKEGVFYTPDYNTRYIVANTVGVWLKEKWDEVSKKYSSLKKNKEYTILTEYRDKYLSKIKILDPACGSGAFLIAAFNYLWKEHERVYKEIKEIKNKNAQGELFDFDSINKTILENNLYGVDLNKESVEITKLSLWLKTAAKNKKLNSLHNNIKCGNSLVDDPKYAGDLAFDWKEAFPEVFDRRINKLSRILKAKSPAAKKSGFDIVIGNPPYVRAETLGEVKRYFEETYNCYSGTADLYTYFYERGLDLLNDDGLLGYISSNKFIRSNYGMNLRSVLSSFQILRIIDFGELPVFEDAATFPVIILIRKTIPLENTLFTQIENLNFNSLEEVVPLNQLEILPESFSSGLWSFSNSGEEKIMKKMKKKGIPLSEYVNKQILFGIKTGFNEAFIISKEKRDELVKKDSRSKEIIHPILHGDNVRKYRNEFKEEYIILTKIGTDIKKYPEVFKHLSLYQKQLEIRQDQGEHWWELRSCAYYDSFLKPKIIYPDIALESRFSFDEENYYTNATAFIIPKNDKYLLALLNSSLIWFYLTKICPVIGDINKRGRLRLKTVYLNGLPIVNATPKDQKPFIRLADIMLSKNKELQEIQKKFTTLLVSEFKIEKLTEKLEDWYLLDWSEFASELKKKKITLSARDEEKWLDRFERLKKEAQSIKGVIDSTDKEIDEMVYELYGLTKEERGIVEGDGK